MSDEKSLSDDLNEMLGDAKDGARKAAAKAEDLAQEAKEKASEFASEAKEKASEFASEAKEKASEFAGEAKERASEFTNDAKEILSDGKNVAIIAHFHLIGWIIALIMNNDKKNEFASFYIRQVLGLILISFVGVIPVFGWFALILVFVLWIMSLISAIGGEKKSVPLLGDQFQEWFKSI